MLAILMRASRVARTPGRSFLAWLGGLERETHPGRVPPEISGRALRPDLFSLAISL